MNARIMPLRRGAHPPRDEHAAVCCKPGACSSEVVNGKRCAYFVPKPIKSVEAEHPVLLFVYALGIVAGIAGSAVFWR